MTLDVAKATPSGKILVIWNPEWFSVRRIFNPTGVAKSRPSRKIFLDVANGTPSQKI